MINNRQAGRRNRGRNNGRPNGGNRGGGDNGNRIDSRARGNAVQLLEKYKNMARDAQMAGDRVNAEYYLQFADHYFRVLADNRARQEEQQQRYRRADESFDEEGEESESADGQGGFTRADQVEQAPYQERQYDRRRDERRDEPRETREPRDNIRRDRNRDRPRQERPVVEDLVAAEEVAASAPDVLAEQPLQPEVAAEAVAEAPRRRGRPRKADVVREAASEELDLAALPPSITRADVDNDGEAVEEAPRKRTRRARPAAEAAE